MTPAVSSTSTITPGRRPSVAEIRAYYARSDILNEHLQAMQRWHVRFVPGYARQAWIYTEDPEELKTLLMSPLELMADDPKRTEYPYFRINWERHHPAHDWDPSTLWGYDFVIEKDAYLWQECFEAMLPVMDILEYFGVYYWLKYTGHHSLHLVIPAEVFPSTLRGLPLKDVHEAVYHRLMVFLNKRARQHFNEHNRHCPPGTNMPYSVNEDTGLVNTPLLREELASFRPWHASIYQVKGRDFWRAVPEEAYGQGEALLEEVLKPFPKQARFYPPLRDEHTKETKSAVKLMGQQRKAPILSAELAAKVEAISPALLKSKDVRARRFAAWALMLREDPSAVPALLNALEDEDADVRWFAVEALSHFGPADALPALLRLPPDDMAGASFVDFCVKYGHHNDTVPTLSEALKRNHQSKWFSLPIDSALERIGEKSMPFLEVLQNDSDPKQRKKAITILNRLLGTPSLEKILSMCEAHNLRRHAAMMLGWYESQAAYDSLTELAEAPNNARARRDAIKSLLWNDHPDAERLFQEALKDKNRKVRRRAEQSLAILTTLEKLIHS